MLVTGLGALMVVGQFIAAEHGYRRLSGALGVVFLSSFSILITALNHSPSFAATIGLYALSSYGILRSINANKLRDDLIMSVFLFLLAILSAAAMFAPRSLREAVCGAHVWLTVIMNLLFVAMGLAVFPNRRNSDV